MSDNIETKVVTIDLDKESYDIYIGSGLLFSVDELIPDDLKGRTVFIITDKNVKDYAHTIKSILENKNAGNAKDVHLNVLEAGEATKSFENVMKVSEWMLEKGLNRNSYVFAIGGGVIGDLGGFCASIAMRGVPYVQIPTSLLAQVDSSVGGKTGINTAQGKNLIGSFYQPVSVLADIDVLKTLPPRELLAGYAEVVKYGLINDLPFFEWLERGNGEKLCALDQGAIAYAVEHCTKAKSAIVEADEKENGVRALLNLGHTFGHALETAAGYNGTLLHGEGVAIGIILAYELSAAMGLFALEDIERVEQHFIAVGLPTRVPMIENFKTDIDSLIKTMRSDKKARSGKMVFILANGIGDTFVSKDVEEEAVREVLRKALGGETIDTTGSNPSSGAQQAAHEKHDSSKGAFNLKGMKKRWKSTFSSRA